MIEPVVPDTATLRDVVRVIERTRRLIAALVDADGRLKGVLSDGDIRRGILAGLELDSLAVNAMTREPIVGPAAARSDELLAIMLSHGVAAIPLVDEAGRFVRVVQTFDFSVISQSWVGGEGYVAAVIMAGGEGRRLLPLTLERPKPMINIGGVPLLERQIRAVVASGLKRIFIATYYLGHVIEAHFGDGSEFGAEISYLREPERMGTAGALSLLPRLADGPILVINGDVLTSSDFGKLLDFHRETQAFATIAAMIHRVEIPFGVLKVDGHRACAIEEKPSHSFLCNAGIYVLTPKVIGLVPPKVQIDMTEVMTRAIARGHRVTVFPLHEYWADIGDPGDLAQALQQFSKVGL
jgi:dTDP-glucose pyrophosphorylase